ncbi:MAG TPA: type II secretion system protein N [Steroidobacteraceae bacterium]|nr:type II secretion system protein N [Steroidobacteraceae bacterium]
MKHRTGWLVALGILALLAFALATLPATVLSGPLGRAGLAATGYGGSVWSGTAQGLAWQGAPLGDVSWSLAPARLLGGRLAGHATLARPDGSLETDFDVALSGADVRLANVKLALPVEALNALPIGMPKGWRGRAAGAFEEVRLADGRPVALRGSLDLDGLVAPPPRNAPLGSFRAVFPHPRPQPSLSIPQDPANLTAQVTDTDGPFAVDAQLTVSPARLFSLEGTLASRGDVPPAMERSLQMLGPADAAGRRQFSVGGSL